jgi:hypothetical protein
MTASDHQSWQRSDMGTGGRYAGRDYYDKRTTVPDDRVAVPGSAGRTLTVLGMIVALTGVAGWLWLVLAFVSSMGGGNISEHPFDTRVAGIPLGSGGFLAIIIGCALALAGNWLTKATRRRYERARQNPYRIA